MFYNTDPVNKLFQKYAQTPVTDHIESLQVFVVSPVLFDIELLKDEEGLISFKVFEQRSEISIFANISIVDDKITLRWKTDATVTPYEVQCTPDVYGKTTQISKADVENLILKLNYKLNN